MQVVKVPIGDVSADPGNVRLHDERNLNAIAASLRRYGQQKPIVIRRDGTCVAGSGTLEAARMIGWSEIAVVYTDLEGVDAIGYGIADNRTAELAEWDEEALVAQLRELDSVDALDPTLWDDEELAAMFDPTTTNEDAANQTMPQKWDILIECKSEAEQVNLLERLTEEGFSCKSLIS